MCYPRYVFLKAIGESPVSRSCLSVHDITASYVRKNDIRISINIIATCLCIDCHDVCFRWWAGPWQHCSVTCGDTGIHRRTVICVRRQGPDEQIALEDFTCADQKKLMEVESCHHKEPCPGWAGWITGDWSKVSVGHFI